MTTGEKYAENNRKHVDRLRRTLTDADIIERLIIEQARMQVTIDRCITEIDNLRAEKRILEDALGK